MKLSYSGSGRVYWNNNEYKCDLYLNEEEGGILLKVIVNNGMASFIELPFEIDILQGELSTGFAFSVFDCSRQNMQNLVTEGRSVFTYIARYMLKGIGRDNPNGAKLYKVHFGLNDILEWGTYSGYKVGENYELQSKEPVEIKIYKDDRIALNYIVSASMLPVVDADLLKDEISLSQQGIIEIQSKEPQLFCFFENAFNKVKKLIEPELFTQAHV